MSKVFHPIRAASLALSLSVFAIAPCAVWAGTPDEDYKEASGFYSARIYSVAAQELKKFLDANPAHEKAKLAAYQWAAAIFRADKDKKGPDFAAAATAYEWALQKYPAAPAAVISAARFELGEAYYFLEKSEKVIAPLQEFLKSPGTGDEASARAAWASYYLGKSYYDLKKFPEAKAAYEKVRDSYEKSEPAPDAVMEIGLMQLDGAQPTAATVSFNLLLTKYPKSEAAPEARVRLGEAQLATKNYTAAREAYRAAQADAKASDFKIDILLGLADTDFGDKKFTDAAQGFQTLLGAMKQDNPRRGTVQLRLGNSHFNAKNFGAAVSAYQPLLNSPNAELAAPALYYSGGALVGQKKFSEAAGNYKKLLDAFPGHALAAKAALRMGDAWADAKDAAKAADAYKIVLTKYEKSDSAKEAQDALTDLASGPGNADAVEAALRDLPAGVAGSAKLRLAQGAFDAKNWTKAAQLALAVADSKPDAVATESALYLAATAKLNGKDAPGAADIYRKQIAAYPQGKNFGAARLGLAWAWEDQQKWPETEAAARAALAAGLTGDLKDRAQLTYAGALFNGGKFKEAATAFGAAEGSGDKVLAAQAAQGGALASEKQTQWKEAAARWAKYSELAADVKTKSDGLLRQGLALVKAKDFAPATVAFDAAIAAEPKGENAAQALYESAWLAQDAKNSTDAAARWARLEKEFPQNKLAPEAMFQQGALAKEAKNWAEAGGAFRRLLDKSPAHEFAPRAGYQLGTALYQQEKWADAGAAFDKAAAVAVKERFAVEAPFWAGESYRKAGKAGDAATRYETFVKNIEGGGTSVPTELSDYLPAARLGWGASVNDAAKQVEIFTPALAKAGGKVRVELAFRLGEALTKQNKWPDALPHLLRAATEGDAGEFGPPAQWLGALALENTGAKTDALTLYKKLAERQPATDFTAKALEKVKALQ